MLHLRGKKEIQVQSSDIKLVKSGRTRRSHPGHPLHVSVDIADRMGRI